jgi:hypothetical protein
MEMNVYYTVFLWVFAFLLGLGIALFATPKAECQMCWTGTCFNSSMCGGEGCVCMKQGMDLTGKCYSMR